MKNKIRIAILGGGPSGLFMFKRLIEAGRTDIAIDIFEKKKQLGVGMPYSTDGANDEHITNVSGNEIPNIVTPITEWIKTVPQTVLDRFRITPEKYNDFKVLPRLLFGQYLAAQFQMLIAKAQKKGILNQIHFDSQVIDIAEHNNIIKVEVAGGHVFEYDKAIICTGHNWPLKNEGTIPGYYDSPYPPSKLALTIDHPVAIKGASLTAIDAIRTLARYNGVFKKNKAGKLSYKPGKQNPNFKLVMHSRNGLLPAIRFHLKDPQLSKDGTLTKAQIQQYRDEHNGFLSLEYVFEKNFKDMFKGNEPEFYDKIKDMSMEQFVNSMMQHRENIEPFKLFEAEYKEAARSIEKKHSVYWKEKLAILSFAMNYPAKYLPAEDMEQLQKVLMPLISIVIAFVPQSSCEELLALHAAGVLDIISVGDDSHVEPEAKGGATYHYTNDAGKWVSKHYKTFVDCVGQPHLSYEQFPYQGLVKSKVISPARLKFMDNSKAQKAIEIGNDKVDHDSKNSYYLNVPGVTINDNFQAIDHHGKASESVYIMAVPYIGGYNPDYSGLDFCEESSGSIIKSLFNK